MIAEREWDRKTLRFRTQVVRLHGGPRHGKIVQLTSSSLKQGRFLVPLPVSPHFPGPEMPITMYRRYTLAWYDDVENITHLYDYWLADDAKLPELRRPGTLPTTSP